MEILITIAILGILVVIAASNFGGMNEKYKVEAETKQLYADLMDARGRAMQRNRWFFVQISDRPGTRRTRTAAPRRTGTGLLTTQRTRLVTSVTVRHAISTDLAGGSVASDSTGTGSPTTTESSGSRRRVQPDYDCITIKPTRIKMGQYEFAGRTCVEK